MAPPSLFELSPMDAVMSHFGLTMLYIYDPPADIKYSLDALRQAFLNTVTLDYAPVLIGKLAWEPSRRGAVCVQRDEESSAESIPFAMEPSSPLTTPQALATLSNELLMPTPRADKHQILKVKCSVLADGGLAIGLNLTHTLFDGEAMFTFMKVWGQHYRRVTGIDIPEEIVKVSHDRHLLGGRSIGPSQPHPEFRVPVATTAPVVEESGNGPSPPDEVFSNPDKPVQSVPPPTKQHVFHFTPAMLKKIKDIVGGPVDAPDYSYVSTIDSLTALFIVLVTRARNHGKDIRFTTGVNARKRFDPPLPKNYVGNVIFNSFSAYTAAELSPSDSEKPSQVELSTLRAIAKRVRASIIKRDDEFLRDAIEFVTAQEDMGAIQVGTDFFFGPDLMFTSWVHMGMYDANFGAGKACYACVPELPCCDGMNVFIEAMHHGEGIELIVFLEAVAMDRLVELWSKIKLWDEE